MSLLKSLFNWARPTRNIEDDISFDESFVTIRSIDYFGWYKISKSGEWIISWLDADTKKRTGGFRESGHGRYVLYNVIQNAVVLQGELERPNHGAVANNGCFSIEDLGFGSG